MSRSILIGCMLLLAGRLLSQKAVSFDSAGDYLEIPHDSALAPRQFTIEFWLKVEDTGDPDMAGGEQTLLDKRDGEAGFNFRLAGPAFPLSVFAITLPGDVAAYDVIQWNVWYHIAVTQTEDTLKIYLNGELRNRSPNAYAWDTRSPLRVGEFLGYPGAYLGFRGDLDELRIWDYSRSGEEINTAMHEKLSGTESGLAAYWDFDSGMGDTVPDLTPKGNHGILSGGATLVGSEAPVGFVPPDPPLALRTYGNQDIVQLSWRSVEDAGAYLVYRGDSLGYYADGSSLLAEVTAPDTSYTDSTAVPGMDHYYCIRSSSEGHKSAPGSMALGRTLARTGNFRTGTYYYPWYGPEEGLHEWEGQYIRDLLIPRQPPMLGHYSSRDPRIIRQHLNWMEACGIDFAVMSWWGINSREDLTLRDYILGELDSSSVEFSIYYESAVLGLEDGQITIDGSNEDTLVSHFNYIADTYFDHPNYLRIDGKPVVFLYLSERFAGNFGEAFARVRSEISEKGFEVFLIGDEVGWGEPSVSHMGFLDAVSPYIVLPHRMRYLGYPENGNFFGDISVQAGEWEKAARQAGIPVIPDVVPGFNNRPVSERGYVVPRQSKEGGSGTSMLEEYIRVMLPFVDPDLGMIMITSWNEWHEDTQVEPSVVTTPTRRDVSPEGDHYTYDLIYEGYGFRHLEVIRNLLAAELPEPDYSITGAGQEMREPFLQPGIFPNPARGSLTLEYMMPESGILRIDVCDAGGRMVRSLSEGFNEQGNHRRQFNVQQLDPGLYLLRLSTGKFHQTKKFLVR